MDPLDLTADGNAQLLVETLQMNMHIINKVRILMFIVGGIMSGIMGLTSLNGLLMLFLTSMITSMGFLLKLKFDIKKYTNANFFEFTFSGISANAMSFVLFWTLSYALVYLY